MARLATGIKDDGRVRLFHDQIGVIKNSLLEYLKNHPEFTPAQQMLVISSFQRLSKPHDTTTSKNKNNRSNLKAHESQSGEVLLHTGG